MTKQCDNRSVGVLITDQSGRYLMFDRNTFPPGVAGAAGHVDDHGSVEDAARIEVSEELGLTVATLTPVLTAWRDNRCRRLPGPAGIGHRWHIYRAGVTGPLTPSARETRNVRWLTTGELQQLTDRTAAYAHGHLTDAEFAALPGIEPVWVAWLVAAGVVTAAPADLAAIDQVATYGRTIANLIDTIAEEIYEAAHDNCEEDGCSGGGLAFYRDEVKAVLTAAAQQPRADILALLNGLDSRAVLAGDDQ